ncbi:hypothetical protein MBEBAB_2178 [Brevundimonas abyssalis TAR-001]|uniref:Uncharacterized protein n=1 Tax=Brevundimonas abyssalis TAR-001 TaxID=1391729 RepID=A0A8E0NCL8_9CAUL|nr:hypothetical protein MBEBAB_2178 [Brevundimonas abyssalis TAR-001]
MAHEITQTADAAHGAFPPFTLCWTLDTRVSTTTLFVRPQQVVMAQAAQRERPGPEPGQPSA